MFKRHYQLPHVLKCLNSKYFNWKGIINCNVKFQQFQNSGVFNGRRRVEIKFLFWVLMPYEFVGRYKRIRETHCLHFQGWRLTQYVCCSEALVSTYESKFVTTQKNIIVSLSAVRTSNVTGYRYYAGVTSVELLQSACWQQWTFFFRRRLVNRASTVEWCCWSVSHKHLMY
jgi:hypothetical protein